jgi:hypothetical protein
LEFIDIPTEKTTAVTDAILAIMAIVAAVYLNRIGQKVRFKTNLWIWVFCLMSLASILGSLIHGFKITKTLQVFLWYPLYLFLGLVVALFIVAVVYDIWGKAIAQQVLPIMIIIGVSLFGITLVWPNNFLVFIIYEITGLLFALGGYIWCGYRRRLEGAWLMAAGVFVSIIAAGVQASNVLSFTFLWSFDHNGVFHLIQMVGVVLLVTGLKKAML